VAPLPRHDLIFFQRLGGFTPDGREYVITTAHGQVTPAPWVNVLANPHFGTVVSESGSCLHLERKRPRIPPHSLGQRPGERFERRSLLPARRRARPLLVAHAAALPRGDAVRHPARIRLQRLRAHRARHPLGAVGLRGPGRAIKFSVLKVRNESGPIPPALRHRICGMGAGRPAAEIGHARDHRNRPEQRRALRAQPYNTEFRDRTAFFDVDDATRTVSGDRTEFLGRNGTLRESGRHDPHAAFRQGGGGLDPCAAIQVASIWPSGRSGRSSSGSAWGRTPTMRRNLVHRFRGAPRRAAPSKRCGSTGPTPSARFMWKPRPVPQRAGQRLAAVPDPGVPPLGAQRIPTSRGAPSVSAISCRT
jgi:cyclic beta-1,2-glucan synthetase